MNRAQRRHLSRKHKNKRFKFRLGCAPGKCSYCNDNRQYSSLWRLEAAKEEIKLFDTEN